MSETQNPDIRKTGDIQRTIEAVWKIESTRLIAGIAHVTRDIGIAEELAQECPAFEETC